MNYSDYNLPPECDGVNPCDSEACQIAVASTHIIPQAEFDGRIKAAAGAPKVITATDMLGILAAGSCENDVVILDQNLLENAMLNPQPAPTPGTYVAYSYLTIKGIIAQGAETFNFYLANGSGGVGNDVIFSVEFGTAAEQFYDGSNTWP